MALYTRKLSKDEKVKDLLEKSDIVDKFVISSVDQNYIDNKMQEFKSSIGVQIDLVAQNVSNLIYTHGNETLDNAVNIIYTHGNEILNNAVNIIYSHGNHTIEDVKKNITNYTEAQLAQLLKDLEKEFENVGEDISHNKELIDMLYNHLSKIKDSGAATTVCPLMTSLKDVANLKHDAHLSGCNQPANSFPVFEELNGKGGIVAYLPDGVSCVGKESNFDFSNSSGQCWMSENI